MSKMLGSRYTELSESTGPVVSRRQYSLAQAGVLYSLSKQHNPLIVDSRGMRAS